MGGGWQIRHTIHDERKYNKEIMGKAAKVMYESELPVTPAMLSTGS